MPAVQPRRPAALVGPVGGRLPERTNRKQWVLPAAVIVAGIVTIRPLDVSGQGLAVALLLLVNCAVMAARLLPETGLPPRFTVAWMVSGILAAAALMAVSDSGTSYLFAFFLAAYIGYRLDTGPALALAAACGLLCGGALFLVGERDTLSLATGLATGAPVLAGIAGRSRNEATQAVIAAAEASEHAARAEARTAVLTERGRIARDIHDVLAHALAGVNMQLELVDALIETGDLDRVREATDKAHSLVKDSLRQAQWTVHALREDSLPLVESLAAMLDSSGHRNALTVTGTVPELPAQVTQGLLRIAQEALTNAARHAPGGAVGAHLTYSGGSTTLMISNRPATERVTEGWGSGMGLIGMRERVALLGGALTVGPVTTGADRGGWRVEAVIPG
ncbi:Signal transduction histidine-protein kinase/phosphatase DegS [Streptomyces sp. ADI96-02]|uniref:sensor histidine kinase n=1 Tax=Streptomyces sp. ADI96-02 TaxID=1522760 RepID=UPI000F55782B|nr:histidine kinase [Streptomyces sp. ADI96-02]RPK54142.1 Signal transduction histidine-protein kinase/phosphatase DegS [Streptomyces sp. ADI96-02]